MGSTMLGDLASGSLRGMVISHASVASNGANAVISNIGALNFRAPQAITIVEAWWEPTGADSAVTNTSSFRRLTIVNGGASGLGTTVLGTLDNTTSQASNTLKSVTMVAGNSVAQGHNVCFSHATVGGAETNGTVLVAGNVHFTYRPI